MSSTTVRNAWRRQSPDIERMLSPAALAYHRARDIKYVAPPRTVRIVPPTVTLPEIAPRGIDPRLFLPPTCGSLRVLVAADDDALFPAALTAPSGAPLPPAGCLDELAAAMPSRAGDDLTPAAQRAAHVFLPGVPALGLGVSAVTYDIRFEGGYAYIVLLSIENCFFLLFSSFFYIFI